VQRVLREIGAENVPQLLVFNKIDAMAPQQIPRQQSDVFDLEGTPVPRVFASARTGAGFGELRQMLAREVQRRESTESAEAGEFHETAS
jgi:GTPase